METYERVIRLLRKTASDRVCRLIACEYLLQRCRLLGETSIPVQISRIIGHADNRLTYPKLQNAYEVICSIINDESGRRYQLRNDLIKCAGAIVRNRLHAKKHLIPLQQDRKLHLEIISEIAGALDSFVVLKKPNRNESVKLIAHGMYESREFSAMPILADALEDAGCEDAAVLAHCRDPHAVHVRGCWVVDLVLGKK